MSKAHSFSSAGAYPLKLLAYASEFVADGPRPIHPQIYPTNECNLNCSFCSCKGEDRFLSMGKKYARDVVVQSVPEADAITFSGGGDPLLFDGLTEMVEAFGKATHGPKMGLVSNGLAVNGYHSYFWKNFEWIRLSMDGSRKKIPVLPVDHPGLSYSWVYRPGDENSPLLARLVAQANLGNITHLRIVSDILDDNAGQCLIRTIKPSDGVIIQPRHQHTQGAKRCYMPLIKPVFAPDGVYTCCGAQYAIKGKEGSLPVELRVAENPVDYFDNVAQEFKVFDGSICDVCYYSAYNELMDKIMSCGDVAHGAFV